MLVLYYAHVKIVLIYQQHIFFKPFFFFYSKYSAVYSNYNEKHQCYIQH